ncbi:MAG: DNA polymerase I [Clostridia bacterium]|jgi:DNA polymerase-1|nr:DNA polymerase I [Clostridia bacterium]MDD4275993.1 DNA polymerase I [Clostridia bacterium]
MPEQTLLLIDGNSLMFRAFYALPPLSNSRGEYVNAIYGFTNMLVKMITEHKPTHIIVAFDTAKKTFRNALYPEYKATRGPTPTELITQIQPLKNLLKTMKIEIEQREGFEGDDIIGTFSKKFKQKTIILTADRDTLQLIDDSTEVWLTKKGISELERINEATLKEKYFMLPAQVVDYKALLGDASDNIPGVKGVGEKTALSLISEYGSLDNIYKNIENIKGALKQKLIEQKDSAYLSQNLATIRTDLNFDCNFADAVFDFPFSESVKVAFEKLEFKNFLKRDELFKEGGESATILKSNTEIVDLKKATQIENLIRDIKLQKFCAIYIDDSGFNFALNKAKNYVLSIKQDLLAESVSYPETIAQFKDILGDSNVKKVVFDSKALKHRLIKENVELNGVVFDVSIALYLIDTKIKAWSIDNVCSYYNLPVQNLAAELLIIRENAEIELKKYNLKKLYYEIELPLVNVLFDMEQSGFKIDVNRLDELSAKYKSELDDLTQMIYHQAGLEFNINSPKQLGEVLFDRLKLNASQKDRSTGVDVLDKLYDKHPVIPLILRYRKIAKLLSTYIDGFKTLIDPKTNIIHTIFNQTLTTTGRLSSSEPNLQNIPVRDDEGRILREMFIPREKNNLLICADYSQIELRLLAHYSGDEALIHAFKTEQDIHSITAAKVFNVDLKDVTKEMRRAAKAVNFGIIYGISDYGLSQNIGTSRKFASEYIKRYFETYPKVKTFMDSSVNSAKQNGYVTTLMGRMRKIPEINSSNFNMRQFGERAAMNMPLQGTASDIIKLAMLKVFKAIQSEKLKSKLILQIHDELIVDAPKEEARRIIALLKENMENVLTLNVPLIVDVDWGKNWCDTADAELLDDL